MPGGGVQARELPMLHRHLKPLFGKLILCPRQLDDGWTSVFPASIKRIEFHGSTFVRDEDFDTLRRGLGELQKSAYFTRQLTRLSICWFQQDEAVMEPLLESLLLSPMHRPRALTELALFEVKVRPRFVQRLRAAYPTVKVIGQ